MDSSSVTVNDELNRHDEDVIRGLFNNSANSAICFDLGQVEIVEAISVVPELVRLPYPITWFEGIVVGPERTVVTAALAFDSVATGQGLSKGNWITALLFRRLNNQWQLDGTMGLSFINGSTMRREVLPPNINELTLGTARWICCFLSALNCTNVQRIEHAPPAALQKARSKKGKKPLFSYWTLHLDLVANEGACATKGTHASPRLHLRRGHPRQFAPGKWTWIPAHAVGNKKLGMIHKDYAVKDDSITAKGTL